jgi:hypothetical protein
MGSNWTRIITHYDRDAGTPWTSANISDDVDTLPLFTDTSDGTVNTASVIINANRGHYIRDQRSGETGFPSKIDTNDRIRIKVTDGITSGSYDQVFEVVRKIPVKTQATGTQLKLECEGIERHLQKIKYIKPHYFTTPTSALTDLVNYYNDNKSGDMPTLTIGTNQLPDFGSHHFDWGVNEDSVYNRILELIDLMGASGSAGGLLDFFDFRFTYSTTDVTSFTINVFSSGSPSSGSEITVENADINNGADGGIDESQGTLIAAWGTNGAGSLPIDYSRFKSRQQLMSTNNESLFSRWQSDIAYPIGSIIQYEASSTNTIYRRKTSNVPSSFPATPPNLDSNWQTMTTAEFFGTNSSSNYTASAGVGTNKAIQYSPWTSGKSTLWKNSGGDPLGTKGPFGSTMFDGNLIINDDTTFRTWVDFRTTTGALDTAWLYSNSSSGAYDGLRVLVDDNSPSSPFNGTDVNGKSFAMNVAEYTEGAWRVKYDTFGNPDLDSMQVAVFDESKVYVWNNPTVGAWNEVTSSNNGSDCFHPYDSIGSTTSVHVDADTEAEFGSPNNGSGIKATYTWSPLNSWLSDTFAARNTSGWYEAGAWLGIRFPFPKNDLNSISENVGDIYGGGKQGTTVKEPSAIDAQNMHFTHNGFRGFNIDNSVADSYESLDYGQLSSIDFYMKIIYTFQSNFPDVQLPKANFKMRAWMFDKSDNVVYQDFTVAFNNVYQSVSLPLSGFQIYRGRRPKDLGFALNDIFPPKGILSNEIFEWRHIVGFCVGTLESYDEQGRYTAGTTGDFGPNIDSLLALAGLPISVLTGTPTRKVEMWMDGLRFTKPLLYVTDKIDSSVANTPDLVKQPDFLHHPDVGNFDQLQNIAKSEKEKALFINTEYDITTELLTDIKFGDFMLYSDSEIVDETDTADNTVKLVAKHIEYSITKPIEGAGGALRRIRGSRRFV